MQPPLLATAVLALFAGVSLAQVNEGQFLATVNVTPPAPAPSIGEFYLGDTVTRSLTLLTIPAQLTTDRLNSVLMVSPSVGYVSTIPLVFPPFGDIYQITLAGTTVTATQLNTGPVPGTNISQLAIVGVDILFTCQTPGNTLGMLCKVPIGGGLPTILVDFSTVTGFTALVNSMAASGNKAYVGTFTPSQIWEVDLATNVPTRIADVPLSRSGTGTSAALLVNLQFDPNSPTTLVAQGVLGDYYRYNVLTQTLIDHRFSGTNLPTPGGDNLNSFAIDTRTGDYLAGTRDGNLDLFVFSHNGEKVIPGLGTGTTTQNSVTGMWYRPFTLGTYTSFGAGCSGQGGFTPTTFGLGTPRAGTTSWGVGVASGVGGGLGLLGLGTSNTMFGAIPLPLGLAGIGLPACDLRVSLDFTFIAAFSGAAGTPGVGIGVVPFALPNELRGGGAYCQWITFTNTLALDALSDGRRIGIE